MNNVKIIGTGSYAPKNIVTNDDLSKLVDTSDEWISSRTGIKERRITEGEDTSSLAAKAALEAIKSSGVSPLDIELIIVATTSPDSFTPSTACLVQALIGADNAVCFDIAAACSGFIYAMNTAVQYIKCGTYKTALIIGAEVLSKILDWSDRSTCVLFGDGSGAAILKASDDNGILAVHIGSDGKKAEFLKCPAAKVNNPFINNETVSNSVVSMNGREIFKFASRVIPKSIGEVLKNTQFTLEDIKYIIPHQANMRIIETAAKKLEIDCGKFYMNVNRYGNTSAASIPIALDEMVKEGLLKKGDKVILVGFGGGLTFGSALIQWLV